ncbi:uncharacterized mitochondrial protein AtMg00810-like [Impatiens glandulifera]|uniref:uncharacterized mitochondrial protein AtMg00810-like n=1 Tax=Impatiens glandulifera TaxID=253017 RepID=UPI001FB0D4D1|nr:uncharacterized mitochondrial protein AtMg00810-like [Impatiens glandulifera]
MKDLGPLSYFLGIVVTRHKNCLFLSQTKYAHDIIKKAGMTDCNPASTPVDSKGKMSTQSGISYRDPTSYRSLCGALQYLTFTRPDISYVVQQVCLFMHAPQVAHMNALKRIIRYIQGTADYGLQLYKSSITSLISYTDADWDGCPDTRRSTSGYCVFLGDNLISWSSKRCSVTQATLVYCDNVSAIYLSSNPVQHQRTKHIEMDIHFVREKVQRGEVRVLHVSSRYQIADIFTKGLPKILFDDFRASLSVCKAPVSTAEV